jgi:hypothetical protein
VTALISGGVAAYAATRSFTDVPPSNPFYADINWMAGTGITTGYPDGGFHPAANVTRQSMSAFMHRLVNGYERVNQDGTWTSTTGFGDTASCPSGKIAVGGGGSTSNSNTFITDSYSTNSNTAWHVRWETENNASTSGSYDVFVICQFSP